MEFDVIIAFKVVPIHSIKRMETLIELYHQLDGVWYVSMIIIYFKNLFCFLLESEIIKKA
jgi:hypothetical protein